MKPETLPSDVEPRRQALIALAAERLFSEKSFEGVSIRDIANEAGVPHGLVRYYFGSKDQLYQTVFRRRYLAITKARDEALARLKKKRSAVDQVKHIFLAWFTPLFMLREEANGSSFARLLVREGLEAENDRHGIFRSQIDPSAQNCIAALQAVLPKIPRAQIARGYLWSSAVFMSSIQGTARLNRMVPSDLQGASLEAMATFVAHGFLASVQVAER